MPSSFRDLLPNLVNQYQNLDPHGNELFEHEISQMGKDFIIQSSRTTGQSLEFANLDIKTDKLNEDEKYYRHQTLAIIILIIGYSLVVIVGAFGNSLVVLIIWKSPRLRTVTNFFILNLAVADLLVVTVCLPPTLVANIFVPWRLGYLLCKVVPYIQGVTVCASVYSLVAISIERFLAIWFPLRCQVTKKKSLIVICGIWLWSLTLSLPWLIFFDLSKADPEQPDVLFCVETWPSGVNGNVYYVVANLGLFYLLPLSIISVCYFFVWLRVWRRHIPLPTNYNVDSTPTLPPKTPNAIKVTDRSDRGKKGKDTETLTRRVQMQMQSAELQHQKSKAGVLKMLLVVVLCFILAWLPLYLIFTRLKLGRPLTPDEEKLFDVVTPLAQWFGASNSCINPILYGFFNAKFRRAFLQLFKPGHELGNSRPRVQCARPRAVLLHSASHSRSRSRSKSKSNKEKDKGVQNGGGGDDGANKELIELVNERVETKLRIGHLNASVYNVAEF